MTTKKFFITTVTMRVPAENGFQAQRILIEAVGEKHPDWGVVGYSAYPDEEEWLEEDFT